MDGNREGGAWQPEKHSNTNFIKQSCWLSKTTEFGLRATRFQSLDLELLYTVFLSVLFVGSSQGPCLKLSHIMALRTQRLTRIDNAARTAFFECTYQFDSLRVKTLC